MLTRKARIRNKAGIHCRPSSCVMMKAAEFPECNFTITCSNGESDLSSILSLISLGMEFNQEATVTVSGPSAEAEEAALDAMIETLECEFDFPPRE